MRRESSTRCGGGRKAAIGYGDFRPLRRHWLRPSGQWSGAADFYLVDRRGTSAQLEAKLAGLQDGGAATVGGVYPYATKPGRRRDFKYR